MLTPNLYIDLHFGGAGTNQHAGRAMTVLHAAFTQIKATLGFEYAIDLPRYSSKPKALSLIRVFASDMQAMVDLIEHISPAFYALELWPQDLTPSIKRVSTGHAGYWAQCSRYRVLSRNHGVDAVTGVSRRLLTLRHAAQEDYPYFVLNSFSNGNRYSLFIKREVYAQDQLEQLPELSFGVSNYGLSTAQARVLVPVLD